MNLKYKKTNSFNKLTFLIFNHNINKLTFFLKIITKNLQKPEITMLNTLEYHAMEIANQIFPFMHNLPLTKKYSKFTNQKATSFTYKKRSIALIYNEKREKYIIKNIKNIINKEKKHFIESKKPIIILDLDNIHFYNIKNIKYFIKKLKTLSDFYKIDIIIIYTYKKENIKYINEIKKNINVYYHLNYNLKKLFN